MGLYLFYYSSNSTRPSLYHKGVVKEETTYQRSGRGYEKKQVDREYVQGLKWSVKHEEVLPVKHFKKDVHAMYLCLTDDLERSLRRTIPMKRDRLQ